MIKERDMRFERESGAVLFNDQLIYLAVGDEGRVDFYYEQIWPVLKILLGTGYNRILSTSADEVRFVHVHPDGMESYSDVDQGLVKAWLIALPAEVMFFFDIIFSGMCKSYLCKWHNGKVIMEHHCYYDITEDDMKEDSVLRLLKELSYGEDMVEQIVAQTGFPPMEGLKLEGGQG